MYTTICARGEPNHLFKKTWKSANRLRHKIFFWLLLHDRVNTRNLLKRKSMPLDSYECALCNDHIEETLGHLFWNCPFAQDYWNNIFPSRKLGISNFDDIMIIHSLLPAGIALDVIDHSRLLEDLDSKKWEDFQKGSPKHHCWKCWLRKIFIYFNIEPRQRIKTSC